jgi:hypothetical protein
MAYVFAVRPYRAALSSVRDRQTVERELLARELALLESGPALPTAMEEANRGAAVVERRMVRAPNHPLAEAELTEYLQASALRSRVLLEEIRSGADPRGEAPPPGMSVVRLYVSGESDLRGIMDFLEAIEGSLLLLRVQGLALEPVLARPEPTGEGEEGAPQDARPTGVVEFQVILEGFARLENEMGSGG